MASCYPLSSAEKKVTEDIAQRTGYLACLYIPVTSAREALEPKGACLALEGAQLAGR